ncbi:uncharacterized protein K452DRAFT_277207 [Aplosporella prunicola CBS 121167]|uniref:Fe2OG dioxygenase domain-containing protein n=1 Tax=Aplosporella prunicola CBS 121167 TaxID=1176127 RepID=A0A6A6B602_9PEZI|nr:uncharacterized protein K452DRAFT_277207 [Aplosporella prunicola CBS 121167]KAF2138211.1 hypothetical protein K452DRAFT_277207 [Aplosporella prunicola CBS 121167]
MAEIALPVPPPSIKATPIIREQIRTSNATSRTTFDPNKHLNYVGKPETLSLKDLGFSEDVGISTVAVSNPFPLFDESAMRIMRSEIFTNEVWDNCMWSTDFAGCQLRGHCPKYAPFMYDAWKHPKTLSIVSEIAGVDLIPVLDVEIGNINISVMDPNEDKAKVTKKADDDVPVTKWHVDSYPFVCVVMMSDTSDMVGGETALKTASGEIMKVRGPQMGCAIVLQGRYITHQALAAVGGTERITMITAFRPRDAFMPDDSVLTTIRPITNLSELYFQWTEYRIEILQERLRGMLKVLEEQHRAERPTDVKRIKEFLKLQEEWLSITNKEIHNL